MKIKYRTRNKIILTALCFTISLILSQFSFAQNTEQQAKSKIGQRGGFIQMDPRAQNRTYHFKETNEDLKYCLFVSSKVNKDKKAPLIVTLHGLGAGPSIMLTKKAVDLASYQMSEFAVGPG